MATDRKKKRTKDEVQDAVAVLQQRIRTRYPDLNAFPTNMRVTNEDVLLCDVDAFKDLDCPAYDLCLSIAATAAWSRLSCRACPEFRKKRHMQRHIRKVKAEELVSRLRKSK